MEKANLNESIIQIRVDLQNRDIKKSGKNAFARYGYFELKDFLPHINELMLEHGVNDIFTIEGDQVKLKLIKGEEVNEYIIPFVLFETPLSNSGKPSMQDIQYLGALTTYYKRYIYMNAFGITDGEVIDAMDNSELNGKKQPKNDQPQNNDEMVELGIKKGLATILKSLQKDENVEFKPQVQQAMCEKYNVDKWGDIRFDDYNGFIKEVQTELQKLKDEKEVGF